MSEFSPRVVDHAEPITRFVFFPFHKSSKGFVKPPFFDQIISSGCSFQRDAIATREELGSFVKDFLNSDSRRVWLGVTTAKCEHIRKITMGDKVDRAICVYDTALSANPAHGELFCAGPVNEEDRVELRNRLWKVFDNGAISAPESYRGGCVWTDLPHPLRVRAI